MRYREREREKRLMRYGERGREETGEIEREREIRPKALGHCRTRKEVIEYILELSFQRVWRMRHLQHFEHLLPGPCMPGMEHFERLHVWKLQHLEPLHTQHSLNLLHFEPCMHKTPGPEILGKLRAISCISCAAFVRKTTP